MVLSGVGDALGYRGGRWEYCTSGPQIHAELAQLGGLEAISLELPEWPVSDDTVLHLATAEGLATGDTPLMEGRGPRGWGAHCAPGWHWSGVSSACPILLFGLCGWCPEVWLGIALQPWFPFTSLIQTGGLLGGSFGGAWSSSGRGFGARPPSL